MTQPGDRLPSVPAKLIDDVGVSAPGFGLARLAIVAGNGTVEKLFVQHVSGVTVSGAPAILPALQGEAVA